MPREQRKVIFAEDEVLLAVRSYARMTPDFLPNGEVRSVAIDDAGNEIALTIVVEARYGGQSQPMEIVARTAETVELLIRACLENNIPIPRRAAKHLRLVDGDLALVIDLDAAAAMLGAA